MGEVNSRKRRVKRCLGEENEAKKDEKRNDENEEQEMEDGKGKFKEREREG